MQTAGANYAGVRPRGRTRSAIGYSLDEVLNAAHLQYMLMRHTVKSPDPKGCWLYNGPSSVYQTHGRWVRRATLHVVLEKGYTKIYVARAAYLLDHGIVEGTRRVGHLCTENLCVRPDHLYLMPQGRDYWAKKKPLRRQQERAMAAQWVQEHLPTASGYGLDQETVQQIEFFAWCGEKAKDIARALDLSVPAVESVLRAAQEHQTQEKAGEGGGIIAGPFAAAGGR